MFRSRENGFGFWEVLGIFCVVVIILGSVSSVFLKEHYTSVLKKNFNISSLNLSEQEKTMIGPMVRNVLEELSQEENIAKQEENRLSNRKDITPNNMEQAITELRSAHKRAYDTHNKLIAVCRAANYFSLISDDLALCKWH
ncbi:MAG TPA: hypothetical protein VJC06_02040 [Candidatus Paceibacterota bacterium]